MRRRLGPLFVALIACVWLNQSFGLLTWEKVRYGVFTDPSAHVFDTLRYPFIFLYRRSADEAMYYGTAAQILGQPYDHEVFALSSRGRVTGASTFEAPPPPTDGHWHVPWGEVHLEYPAPVLPFVLAPKLFTGDFEVYSRIFGVTMGLCMVLAIALAIDVLRRAGATPAERDRRWWLGAGLLLAQGALTIQRLDPIVALTMIAAVRGAVKRSPASLGFWAGIAAACKIMPIVLVPVIVAGDWSFWRRRLAPLGLFVGLGLALGFLPMLAASPTAFGDFFRYHGLRGLQVESTFGALVGAARLVLGTTRTATISYGSFNVDGAVPDLLAKACLPLTFAGVAALTLLERRSSVAWLAPEAGSLSASGEEGRRIERITCAALAVTVVVWLGGKVFSPQYLTWAIPLALAIPGRRGVVATWITIAACALTQVYYRGFYDLVFDQRFSGVAAVLVRQAVLAGLLAWVGPWDLRRATPRLPWRGSADADRLAA
jgi:hypothetical protein